jgi:choice-of-anchor B domain-containing protein
VEVTQPGNAQVVAMVPGPTSLWRDVRTYSTYAYAVSEGGAGIQVIDLTAVDAGTVTLVTSVVTGGTEATHTIAIDTDSGFLYRAGGGSNGLRIYSLANPALPVFVGSWSDRYVHEAQVVTYTSGPYAGKQVAFACGGLNGGWVDSGIDILDVTDKSNIVPFSQLLYPNAEYSHQAWLSPDRHWLYLDDELDEGNLNIPTKTFVFDVSNLSTPTLVNEFTNGNSAIGHNLYTLGNLLFEANYRSGLRVFDATDPVHPVEFAWFDTYPADDAKNYNGLWNVFPYFPSGVVIGSDMERGLFVWRVGDPPIAFAYPGGAPASVDPAGQTLVVEITTPPGVALDTASPTLWVDTGSGETPVPLLAQGGDLYAADFPPSACGTLVHWYVQASTLGGEVVSDPISAPTSRYDASARIDLAELVSDAMESDLGWSVGAPSDTATTGIWTRVDPIGTTAQPEDDHTQDPASLCWVTGAGAPGGGSGDADVDGGATTLFSPLYDLSTSVSPTFSYWRWYSNDTGANPGQDTFQVDISPDGGQSWVAVETVGPADLESSGGWTSHSFRPADLIPLTSAVRLRFVASDVAPASVVEAAIDDLALTDVVCVDCNGNGSDDSVDIASGGSTDLNADGIPDECGGGGCADPFIRGDANADLALDISDAIRILSYLFSAGIAPSPLESADIDAGGAIDIADAVQLLGYLFSSGAAPAPPFPLPGC